MHTELITVLAHQGGWDEALYVAVPMAVLVGLLRLAQRRAQAEQDAGAGDDAGDAPRTGAPGPAGPPRRDEP